MSEEINEQEKIIDGLALKLAGIDSWERFTNLIEKNHFIVKANEVMDFLEAAGYRKPAPSEKLVEDLREKLNSFWYEAYGDRGCSYVDYWREHTYVPVLDKYARSIASLLLEMKLIGDEEIEQITAEGLRENIPAYGFVKRGAKAQLATDK